MEKISDSNNLILRSTNKDIYTNIKDVALISMEKTSNTLSIVKNKIKELDFHNATDLSIVKYLQNLYESGSSTICELEVLSNYIDIIGFLDENIIKMKERSRNLVSENKVLKTSLNLSERELHGKECQLVAVEENKAFFDYILSLTRYDKEKEIIDIEYELWHRCLFDRLALNMSSVSKSYRDIMMDMTHLSLEEAIHFAKTNLLLNTNKSVEDQQATQYKSTCLLFVAKFCYESNCYNDALLFGVDSLNRINIIHLNKTEFMSKIMACISLIYYKLNDFKKATYYALDSLRSLESLSEVNNDLKSSLAAQYINFGSLFCHWNMIKEGIQLMESGITTYSLMLPEEESRWLESLAKLAKICNDSNFFEDTIVVCEKVIIFFHNKHICMNDAGYFDKNIFDIAVDLEETNGFSVNSNVEVPPPVVLPWSVQHVVSELAIVFSKNNLFIGAQILDKWLKSCNDSNTTSSNNHLSRFFIQLDFKDLEKTNVNVQLSQSPSTSKCEAVNECSNSNLSIPLPLKTKPFSSKLAILFRNRSNKMKNIIIDDNDNNLKIKNIFKMFKKVS